MKEGRQFSIVPDEWFTKIRCHQCKRELKPGDRYYMTDDDSWLFCEKCASGREAPKGPRQVLIAPNEREPLHKKRTLRELVDGV